MLLHFVVRAHREPDVVGAAREAREHLLAVDHVLVAVAHGARLQRREVGARVGLGVADREVDLALQDLRHVELLLLLAAEAHDRGRDRVDRQHRHGRARSHRLVEEHELLDRREAAAAPLLRPADTGVAVGGHLLPDVLRHLADALALAQVFFDLGREELVVVGAQLVAQRLVLLRQADVHGAPPTVARTCSIVLITGRRRSSAASPGLRRDRLRAARCAHNTDDGAHLRDQAPAPALAASRA